MSYNNFIPTVWSTLIQTERERMCIAAQNCYREFEGNIKEAGDSVRIQGIGRPTIGTYTKNSTVITPENLADNSQTLLIEKSDYFCFEVDDIDKRQAKGGIMDAQMKEAGVAMAQSIDSYIYGLYAGAGTTVAATSTTGLIALGFVLQGLKALWANNVPKGDEIILEVSPAFMEKLVIAKIVNALPNDEVINKGFYSSVLGCTIHMSNGIYNDGIYDYNFLRTKKAIALADQLNKVEAFRPQSSFSDAVKGLHLYGAKVIRPKELVVLKATYASEASTI